MTYKAMQDAIIDLEVWLKWGVELSYCIVFFSFQDRMF